MLVPEPVIGAAFGVDGVVGPGVVEGEAGGFGTSSVGLRGGTSRAAGTGGRVGSDKGTVPHPYSSKSKHRSHSRTIRRLLRNSAVRNRLGRSLTATPRQWSNCRPIDNKRSTSAKVLINMVKGGITFFLVKVFAEVVPHRLVSAGSLFLQRIGCGFVGLGLAGRPGVVGGGVAP